MSEDCQIDGENRQDEVDIDVQRWAILLNRALINEGVTAGAEAGLAFVGTTEMTELNVEHMHGEGPTDVLAFPIDGLVTETTSAVPVVVGDIVICPEVARNAVNGNHTLEDELALLVVHGALHLLGHDHYEPEERERMQGRERVLLERLHTAESDGGQTHS